MHPNARCPVFGAPVYFYGNEHGSRVYFDEVGPPWPKHPCTDNASRHDRPAPPATFAAGLVNGSPAAAAPPYGLPPAAPPCGAVAWTPYGLLLAEVGPTGTRLTLQRLDVREPATVWAAAVTLPLLAGGVVFIQAERMSYFDILRSEPVTVPVSWVGIAEVAGLGARLRELWDRLTAGRPQA